MRTTTATALALLLGLGLALPAAAQQAGADVDQDQFVTAEEAAAFDEQRFGEITGGGEEMTEEQFTGAMTGAEDPTAIFSEVDQDGSGQISRDEWMQWRQQRFTEATAGTEGRMEAGQYETFEDRRRGHPAVGGPPRVRLLVPPHPRRRPAGEPSARCWC